MARHLLSVEVRDGADAKISSMMLGSGAVPIG